MAFIQKQHSHVNKFLKQHQEEQAEKSKLSAHTSIGATQYLNEIKRKIYTLDEIENFSMNEAIEENPLINKGGHVRSKLAYKYIMDNRNLTAKYILPGQVSLFIYDSPKNKEELDYYDKSPLVIMFGIFRTNNGNIREIGLNLHYFPPFTRKAVLNTVYENYKSYFEKCFNSPTHKPNNFMSYSQLKHMLSKDNKIAFAVKEYIPSLRGLTYIIPTKLLPIAYFTEGHFSKATINKVMQFWRQF